MSQRAGQRPDLGLVQQVVAPEIIRAAEVASAKLRESGIPHALAGGLAVGAHGYPRTTASVDFLVGDEAFVEHTGGLVTLRMPLIAVGNVRIDLVSIDDSAAKPRICARRSIAPAPAARYRSYPSPRSST